jgi:serine/threonine protein kinase
MTSERWQRVEEVFQGALDRPPQARSAFLDEACGDDEELRSEATSLIAAYDEAGDFIEHPAIAQDARVLVGELPDANLGRVVGPYRIVERLGAGGMGEVYLAQDTRLGRLVALKILPFFFVAEEMRLRRFQREARAASALNHPNILTIHEVGEAQDVHFIATEFIDGKTIRELIAGEQLSLEEALDICVQTACGLAAAHAAGIVHRDIKPENIMRREDLLVKILDFGIAKLTEASTGGAANESPTIFKSQTETGLVIGTVGYMSPEQARGLQVDERTDIWSLGVVLYEMLTNRAPFAGATRLDTLVAILEREPAPLQFKRDAPVAAKQLQRIVEKCLRKERSERYQTTNALLADLRSVRQELELAALLEGQSAPVLLRDVLEDQGSDEIDGESKTLAPRSSALQALPPTITASTRGRTSWRSPFFVALVAASLLTAAIAVAFLYRRAAARRTADAATTSVPAQRATTDKLYAQMSEAERLAFVDEQEQRISALMGERPRKLEKDALLSVKSYVDRYVARLGSRSEEYGREDLRLVYARATPYVPLIARSFAARKVPPIIGIYLPMIESEYKTCFVNSIGAKGMFQFLPATARQYGVAPEEMCDVEKMTPAAAEYIADRMAELGEDAESMTLVLLSYNRGPEWVREALRQLRTTDNYERNFWTLFAHRDQLDELFRRENAGYVPAFFAAAIVGENPHNFELQTPPLSTLARE